MNSSPEVSGGRGSAAHVLGRIDPEAVGLRELPFTAVFGLVAFIVALQPGTKHWASFVLATVTVVVVQLVAFLGRWGRWPRSWQYVLPLAQMASLVGLAFAAATNVSFLTVLLFLPVVSLALQPAFVGVVLGTMATAIITLLVTMLPPSSLTTERLAGLRIIGVTLCALLVGVGVYAVTQRLRDRTDALLVLQRQQAETLHSLAEGRDRLTELTGRLEASRDLLSSVIDAATEEVVIATDDAGHVLLSSPGAERVLGRTPQQLVGSTIVDVFQVDELRREAASRGLEITASGLLSVLVGNAARGEPERREWMVLRPDGTTVPVDVVVTRRRRLDEPAAEGYLVVVTDLSERKESERLQDEFIGLVSHELRTPLASILGYVDLMRADAEAMSVEHRAYVGVVQRNAQRLLRLVNDLLLSVQVVAGTFLLTPSETDLVDVVAESVANLEPTAAAARTTIVLNVGGAVPLVTDPERVSQVVENLLANAIKFAPAGGTVTVTLNRQELADGRRAAHLVVADNGQGMSSQEVARVTDRFFRTESARRGRVRGLGLGLSIVEAIVGAHGGSMDISSDPGNGTTVDVVLPDAISTSDR